MSASDITHVIFDLDGVLLDTEKLYTVASDGVLAPYGHRLSPTLKQRVMGRTPLYGARLVVDELNLPIDAETFLAERARRLEALMREADPVPGAEHYVAALARRGIVMAVATSSDRALLEVKIARHDWFSSFATIVCADDVERLKPAPDLFLKAAERMAASPPNCLVFEDSPAGIEAARLAGMRVVGLADASIGVEAVRGAHIVVHGYAELLARPIPQWP